MLLFVDESGHDRKEMPCEVLAGVAIAEDNLWNLVRAIRSAEKEHFGDYLRNLLSGEMKAKNLLKRKHFREAARDVAMEPEERNRLAYALLVKGKDARGTSDSHPTFLEIVAFSRSAISFVHHVLDLAASYSVQIFASVVDRDAPRPESEFLRKDYVYLFERYFYYLETLPPKERGLVVFDEYDRARAHVLLHQMAAYFLGSETGRYRSSRVVPEPFFVHSELTTGIFLADLAAYILGWGWRLPRMQQACREELHPFSRKLHEMQFHGDKPKTHEDGVWTLHGIVYIDDLRGQLDRDQKSGPE